MYKCQSCGKKVEVDLFTKKKVQCSFCGFRIVQKKRSPIIRKVLAD